MRVVNAVPLIVLSKVEWLDLPRELRPDIEVVVPQTVLDEVMRGKSDRSRGLPRSRCLGGLDARGPRTGGRKGRSVPFFGVSPFSASQEIRWAPIREAR
jgi:hypothetical protein